MTAPNPLIPANVKMQPVSHSSNVEAVGYDQPASDLYIEFKGHSLYRYSHGIDTLSGDTLREFLYFMTGKQLGFGVSRTVYDHPFDKDKVIKVENSATYFQNVREWDLWRDFEHVPSIRKWLAPCHAISASGTFLIQSKARDLTPQEIPKKLPSFLTDHKPENYGKIGKQVVCRDYGTAILALSDRMRSWRGAK